MKAGMLLLALLLLAACEGRPGAGGGPGLHVGGSLGIFGAHSR